MRATIILSIVCCLSFGNLTPAKGKQILHDQKDIDIEDFFSQKNTTYVISYNHEFREVLYIPAGCRIEFKGGSLKGCIVFNDTRLTGQVDLRGSSIHGTISNKVFNASWLCFIDGITDDAACINEMIDVCGSIFFPKGCYRLKSTYNTSGHIPSEYETSVRAHIGIHRDNVILKGEKGTEFITEEPIGTICVYSKPNNISNSCRNISIRNIEFTVKNNGVDYNGFMHTIKVIGVNGLKILNCVFNDFWGDAICLSHYGDSPTTGERTRNENVLICDCSILGGESHNNRNGISVINGKNIIIKDNLIKDTSSPKQPGGIDIEPNNSAYTIDNILIENNVIEGVRGFVGAIGIVLLRDEAPAHNIRILSNKIYDCNTGIAFGVMTQNSMDGLIIENNYIDEKTKSFNFDGKGHAKNWIIRKNTFKNPTKQAIPGNIKVDNLVVKKNKSGVWVPLLIRARSLWNTLSSCIKDLLLKIFSTLNRWKEELSEWIKGLFPNKEEFCVVSNNN